MRQIVPKRSNANRQRGATILEFAMVMILILFPLMFGIIDFSRCMYAYHWVSYAAREGSRWASVRGSSCPTANPLSGGCPATAAQVQAFVVSIRAPGIYGVSCANGTSTAGCISVNTTGSYMWQGFEGDGTTSCTSGGSGLASNSPACVVRVTVDYYFPFSLPFIAGLSRTSLHLQSTSKMVISQ